MRMPHARPYQPPARHHSPNTSTLRFAGPALRLLCWTVVFTSSFCWPLMRWLWLDAGAGNANFVFFTGLSSLVSSSLLLLETLSGAVRSELSLERIGVK